MAITILHTHLQREILKAR